MATANKSTPHPWNRAATVQLQRVSSLTGSLELVDRGVTFFVLALEALGAVTKFSCEGHPTSFYVAFEAPYALAERIHSAGFFRVEVEGTDYWSIRRSEASSEPGKPYTDADKKRVLRWAAEAWLKRFPTELKHLA